MSRIQVSKATGMPNVDAGVYFATCTEIKDDTIVTQDRGAVDVIRFYLQLDDVLDDDGEMVVLDGMTSRLISPKSKFTQWAEALGHPIDFEKMDDFETEDLVGSRCQVKVTRKDKDSWPRVEDLTALPKGMVGKAPTKPVEAAGDDGFDFLRISPAGDPVLDWTLFWKTAAKHKVTKAMVFKEAGTEDLTTLDPFDVPAILDKLIVPFE